MAKYEMVMFEARPSIVGPVASAIVMAEWARMIEMLEAMGEDPRGWSVLVSTPEGRQIGAKVGKRE